MRKRNLILPVITILFLILVFNKIDFSTLIETFKQFQLKNICTIISIFLLSLYLRGIRWKLLLMNKPKYSAFNLAEIFTVGNMLNIFLPARAGDIFRAYHLGHQMNEKKLKIFGSIIFERLFDGITIFGLLLLATILYNKTQWILHLTISIGVLFIFSTLAIYLIFKNNKSHEIYNFLKRKNINPKILHAIKRIIIYFNILIKGFSAFKKPTYLLLILLLIIIAWALEVIVTCLIINSFNFNLSVLTGIFVLTLTSFSTMIPSSSVLVGPYQAAYILALGLFGITKSQALAISTIHQIIILTIFTVVGVIILLKFNIKNKNSHQ